MPRALLCSFADLNALPHGGCLLFHLLRALDSHERHMTFLFERHPTRLRTATSFPHSPPFYITRPPTPQGTPNSRQQLPDDVELVVTASFLPLETGSSQFRRNLDLHVISCSVSERESIRAGLSRKRGTRLRRENISDSHSRGMCNLIPQGLDIPNCFAHGTPRR